MAIRHWIGLAFCAVAALPARALAEDSLVPPPLELGYDVSVGGITVMHFDLIEHDLGERYRVDFAAHTQGIANWVFGRIVKSSSEGILSHGKPSPSFYVSDTKGAVHRHTSVTFQPGGMLSYTVSPDPAQDPEGPQTPVIPATLTGTTDPLAGLVAMAQGSACDGVIPVFDGRHRYDLQLRKLGNGRIEPGEGAVYAGPVEQCAVHLVRIGGYAVDRTKYITSDDAVMWIARVAADVPPVPVEIVFDGHWGIFRARLIRVSSGATHLGAQAR